MSPSPRSRRLPAGYRVPPEDETLLAECDISFFRSSGPGGQHKNKTMSSVRLHHRPSGLVVIGKRERSQRRNLQDALDRLRTRLASMLARPKPREKTKPSPESAERRLEEKKRRGRLKQERTEKDWD
jgi:protein subunit release factor B